MTVVSIVVTLYFDDTWLTYLYKGKHLGLQNLSNYKCWITILLPRYYFWHYGPLLYNCYKVYQATISTILCKWHTMCFKDVTSRYFTPMHVSVSVLLACARVSDGACADLDEAGCETLLHRNASLCNGQEFAKFACQRTCGLCCKCRLQKKIEI